MTAINGSIIGLLLLMVASAWAGTFKDDFNDGNDDGWQRWGSNTPNPIGKWEFVDGRYVITIANNYAVSVWGEKKWADYTVEIRARSTNGLGGFGLQVRVQDPMNFYIWNLNASSNTLFWGLLNNNQFTIMTQDPAPGDRLKEHLFKVVASGDQFEGYYDGKLIRKWRNELPKFKTGRVAIGIGLGGRAQAVFDDFVMTGDEVPDSGFAVSPQDKLATMWATIKQGR